MRLFNCGNCGQTVYFENSQCVACGSYLGYSPEFNRFLPLNADASHRSCDNAQHAACNWLVRSAGGEHFCVSCRHNVTIPNLSDPIRLDHWRRIQAAQRRAIYSFLQLGLPLANRVEDPAGGLGFDILSDDHNPNAPKVMTGHASGLITIALAEADEAERVQRRRDLGEPYRTVLGHFRHESGHYFWDRLVRDTGWLAQCRAVFGDDRDDYEAALKRHYAAGPPPNWQDCFVSAYAAAHPWEDFAETWAHYLHIADTLEMARALGLELGPRSDRSGALTAVVDFNPFAQRRIEPLMDAWVALTVAINNINRCMGQADAYPFVLAPAVVGKLGFIQKLVNNETAEAL